MKSETCPEFIDAVRESLLNESLIALVISNPRLRNEETPRKQSVRPVLLRGKTMFQWELQFQRQQTHLNLDLEETLSRLGNVFGPDYRDANLFTSQADIIARCTPRGTKLRRQAASRVPQASRASHDRRKTYLIPEGTPCPFLVALNVMTARGQVKQSRQKKFRQINRYLEIVNDIYDQLPPTGVLRVADFGCGLSYLTFALHHLLTSIHHREVELLGIDQNEHVISRCRQIASDLSLQGTEFRSQRIESHSNGRPVDLAVSLHACDTATDHALAYAVSAKAKVILAAPCCQHELMTRIESPILESLLRHGVLKERFSALATDSLRGSALEAVGYRTQILEFIDLEHTPKNLLLRAVRRSSQIDAKPAIERGQKEYEQWKKLLGVTEMSSDLILAAKNSESPLSPTNEHSPHST